MDITAGGLNRPAVASLRRTGMHAHQLSLVRLRRQLRRTDRRTHPDASNVTTAHRRRRLHRADPAGPAELKQYTDSFWATGLARLKSAAEAAHREKRDPE